MLHKINLKNIRIKSLLISIVLLILVCGGFSFWNPKNIFNKPSSNPSSIASDNAQGNDAEVKTEDVVLKKTQFDLSIPKLEISTPVNLNIDPAKKSEYDKALENGVNHIPGTALPDSGKGNIVIYGHSSSDSGGVFGRIFSSLNQLEKGDEIEISYKEVKYKYSVVDKKIVKADDLSVLDQTKTQYVTLLTCWPIGSIEERLIVIGKLI